MNEEPEVVLAQAVIQRVVLDLRNGGPDAKRKAVEDIEAGALDYWIDVVASKYEVADAIRRGLRDLVLR